MITATARVSRSIMSLGVEFGSKLIEIPEKDMVVKLHCSVGRLGQSTTRAVIYEVITAC
jgi:hypothetical protein